MKNYKRDSAKSKQILERSDNLYPKYEKFEELLKSKGINARKVSLDTSIATSTISQWKVGRSYPKLDKIKIIADYFGVTLEYFLEE